MIWAHSVNPATTYVAIALMVYAFGAITWFAGWILYCEWQTRRELHPARPRRGLRLPVWTAGIMPQETVLALIARGLCLTDGKGSLANEESHRCRL